MDKGPTLDRMIRDRDRLRAEVARLTAENEELRRRLASTTEEKDTR